ncbi:Protein OS-9 [Marasmius sp. AFHP31]|nr:Protein OS-9 [Marasmius sp. AFHP31]
MLPSLLLLLLPSSLVLGRSYQSLPPDTYAFPKYKVAFLSNLPVLNETAQKWLKDGLQGGELEFLDQPWGVSSEQSSQIFKEIGTGDSAPVAPNPKPTYSLEHMKMGPRDSYLCFIPAPLDLPPPPVEDDTDDEVTTTTHSWSLLQPLAGHCLYEGNISAARGGSPILIAIIKKYASSRNFHKAIHMSQWESYTLGKAPETPAPGADLTVAQRDAIATNLKLARGAGSRYLVQRWGDGTMCDMTGKPREVEVQVATVDLVLFYLALPSRGRIFEISTDQSPPCLTTNALGKQFHCSMVVTDSIQLVKESKTCSYILVVNTPRLCGEPGFRSHDDVDEQAQIRCREIINSPNQQKEVYAVSEADHPQKLSQPKPVLPSKSAERAAAAGMGGISSAQNELVKRALKAIKGNPMEGMADNMIIGDLAEDGTFTIEILDDDEVGEGEVVDREAIQRDMEKIAGVLRKAGMDVKGAKQRTSKSKDGKKDDEKRKQETTRRRVNDDHDEL